MKDSQKISLQCIHLDHLVSALTRTVLISLYCYPNEIEPFSITCWYQSMSCVVSHCVTTVSTLQSSLNLWLSGFCFSAGNRW